jgi:O-antigen ligase
MNSPQSNSKSAGDVIGYATGLVACIACIAFLYLMFKSGFSKKTVMALTVCFVASVINYYFMSSGYTLLNRSSLSMAEINSST